MSRVEKPVPWGTTTTVSNTYSIGTEKTIVGITPGSGFNGTNITLKTSVNGTLTPVSGPTWTVAASTYTPIDPIDTVGLGDVAFVSGSAETASQTFTITLADV